MIADSGAVGGRDDARNFDDREHRPSRTTELVFVLVEVRAQIGIGDRLSQCRIELRTECDEAHLRAVVLIFPDAPQLRVRYENPARDLIEQLAARHLAPVILLESSEQA